MSHVKEYMFATLLLNERHTAHVKKSYFHVMHMPLSWSREEDTEIMDYTRGKSCLKSSYDCGTRHCQARREFYACARAHHARQSMRRWAHKSRLYRRAMPLATMARATPIAQRAFCFCLEIYP